MAPQFSDRPAGKRTLRAFCARIGLFGLLIAGAGSALGWFALFGCNTTSSGVVKRDIDGMIVNPPDAYMKRWTK